METSSPSETINMFKTITTRYKHRIVEAKFVLCIFIVFCSLSPATAREVPQLNSRIVDEAGLLSAQTKTALITKLQEHENQTSNQVAILTINSLEEEILEEYSLKVAEAWKLGQKKNDNGVLLLIAVKEHQIRIETGYGLEKDLTDAEASQIIRNVISPQFKAGNYDNGIKKGVEAILAAIEGVYIPEKDNEDFEDIPVFFRLIFAFMFVIVIGTFTFLGVIQKKGWFLYFFLIPFWLTFPFVIFGYPGNLIALLMYLVLFPILKWKLPQTRFGQSMSSKFKTSVSSGSSSSSGWSGSSSFSGGGGSFGGGGSSGSW